jgi:hypothetical protein
MTLLATVDDLNVLADTSFGEADTRPVRLLELASGLVQAEAQQHFALVEDEEVVLRVEGEVYLPERPVIDVTSVILSTDGSVGSLTAGFTFHPDGELLPGLFMDSSDVFWPHQATMTVIYSHGYAVIPDDVKAVVCAIVQRWLANPGRPVEAGFDDDVSASSGDVAFAKVDRELIRRRYRRTIRTVPIRSAR